MADAFDNLLSAKAEKGAQALDLLVEQLNDNKERTIYDFLNNRGSEDVLWALLTMLSSNNTRIASNSAFVIGSLAETEAGSTRILSILKIVDQKNLNALMNLTRLLEVEDAETVMNAAGTLATLAETEEGRKWMLAQECANSMMTSSTFLLGSENHWTASNSALVLARMTISESGRRAILEHPRSNYILQRLTQSLGNDTAGRGMNAAFAIGRLLDTQIGKERLLDDSDTDKMTTSLCRMLAKGDMGGAKNACFAISCLAADSDGNQLVIVNNFFQDAVNRLVSLLHNDDAEASWFAAMTLKTISSHKHGVLRLRQNADVEASLLKVSIRPQISKELSDEVTSAIANLKKLSQPDPPYVEVLGSTSVRTMWNRVSASCGFEVTYKLMCDNKIVYKGSDLEYVITDLRPYSPYSIRLRASTMGDDSPYSETVTITTEEDIPTAPTFLRVMGCTPTQLRLTWNSPEQCNGVLRGYYVYLGERLMECTQDTSYIISRLTPSTKYIFTVCAATSKGTGDKTLIEATTEELGAHAPERPTVTVIGRNEMQVLWMPPSVPLGRFFRYELSMNDRVVYQGIDKFYRVTGLTPDTEYTFIVIAITSEGRCASDPTKKKTLKDKSQNEPGHHQLKTHSFKAKEFQATLEKSKSQTNMVPPIQRPKPKMKKRGSITNRPSSNMSVSNASDTSAVNEGSWAVSVNETDNHDNSRGDENVFVAERPQKGKKKSRNAAVIGGAPISHTHPRASESTSILTMTEDPNPKVAEAKVKLEKSTETNLIRAAQTHHYGSTESTHAMSDKVTKSLFKENTLDKENRRYVKTTSTGRTRFRRGHAVMKGKKVLKTDKELLAEMTNQGSKQKTSESNRNIHPKTSRGQKTMHYYPDIVSAIRKQYGHESTIEDDLRKGKNANKHSPDSLDSLNPEPGTARNDLDVKCELPTSKFESSLLSNRPSQDKTKNEIPARNYPRSWTSSGRHFNVSNLSAKRSHMIVKPAANSKYGLKYNVQSNVSNASVPSSEVDSAFHSFLNMQETLEDFRGNTLADGYSDSTFQARTPSSRLKTPPKGYWSDHDVSQPWANKRAPLLTSINYRKFQGAHRPTKSIKLESPAVSNLDNGQWVLGESVYSNDINRTKFIPTQWRTQPANLPTPTKSGHTHYRLEALSDRVKQMEASERSSKILTSSASNHQHLLRPSRTNLTRGLQHRNAVANSNDNSLHTLHQQDKIGFPMSEDIAASVLSLKTGSMLAALNFHHGLNSVSTSSLSQIGRTETHFPTSLPKPTNTVPHTILSPLSPSDVTSSSNTGSISNISSKSLKSPRLRLTSSSRANLHTIPMASGYTISPGNSLSSLSNDTHVSGITTLIPGGGDAV